LIAMSRCRLRTHVVAAAIATFVVIPSARAQGTLTGVEKKMQAYIAASREEHIALLQRAVDQPSGSFNVAGVRKVAQLFAATLDSLGFKSRIVEQPAAMKRGPHLVAEHVGAPGRARLLLIGHLDTVFEGEGTKFVRLDTIAQGAGTNDIKGGDVVMIWALRAMQREGLLKDANITVIMTGDEESAGEPISESRRPLLELAQKSDIALGFEGGNRTFATIARRGASTWRLTVTAGQGHSGGIFRPGVSQGAIYEMSRILDTFRRELSAEENLTFNPGVIVGGANVTFDAEKLSGTAAGKTNIIAPSAYAEGDLRFLTPEQLQRAREKMRAIVAQSLPGAKATIEFFDMYPGMPPTAGGAKLLAQYDTSSRALGHGEIGALPPSARGAGDISFVAPMIDGLDGLGALGNGAHSPNEDTNLNALQMQAQRAAVMMGRVAKTPLNTWRRIVP
jgi:glutamate carboxypeptidase